MVGKIGIKEAREAVSASLALFVIATTDKVVVAIVIVYIGITTCSLSNVYYSSKLWGSLQNLSLCSFLLMNIYRIIYNVFWVIRK